MKRFLSLLLALSLVFSLVACSNEKNTASEPNTSTTTQTETESANNSDTQASESLSDTETPSNTNSSTPQTNTSKPTTDTTESSKHTETSSTALNSSGTNNKPHQHVYVDATCTEPKKCSCGQLYDPYMFRFGPLGHTCDASGVCQRCKQFITGANEFINFNDNTLEILVRQKLQECGATVNTKISKYDMTRLSNIYLKNGVKDVQDLIYAINLNNVVIETDGIKNLNVLTSLPITHIVFANSSADISFMKDMKKLTRILVYPTTTIIDGDLSFLVASPVLNELHCKIVNNNINYLKGSLSLSSLDLGGNITDNTDISVLSELQNLKSLTLYDSPKTDAQTKIINDLMSKGVRVTIY